MSNDSIPISAVFTLSNDSLFIEKVRSPSLASQREFWYIFQPIFLIHSYQPSAQKGSSMKQHFITTLLSLALASFLFQGFQCGSPEFTGAKVHIQQKNYKEAIRLLEIEVQKNPANEEAWFFLGGLKADEGDYDGMNTAFKAALKLSDKHASEMRAIRYNHWGQNLNAGVNYLERASSDSAQYYERSITSFHKAATAWPDTSLTYRYMGYAYNNKGDYDNAMSAFRKAWDFGKDNESIKRVGRIYNMRGDDHKSKFETANAENLKILKNLEEVKRNSNRNEVMRILGAPDNITKGPKGTKKEEWTYNTYKLTFSMDGDKVMERKAGQPPFRPSIDSTEYQLAQGEYAKAVEALEIARAADPKDNETLQALLKAYVESNRIEPAIKEFEKAIAAEPGSKVNHYVLGVLYRTVSKYDQAIAQFKEALRIDPNDCEALLELAATYYNWGVELINVAREKELDTEEYKPKFEAALPYMEKVTECKKDDPTVWESLGQIYARLGQQDKAMKAFEQADKIRKGN